MEVLIVEWSNVEHDPELLRQNGVFQISEPQFRVVVRISFDS